MSKNQRLIKATPHTVFEVLADGWLYPSWVVGASRIRDVDASWPDEGAQIHHSVGTWPLLLDDTTSVLKSERDRVLVLRARAWPGGEADVVIELEPAPGGTRVTIYEDAVRGPGKYIPGILRHTLLGWRNVETLQRLAFIAEGHAERTGGPTETIVTD